jgi:hypothetical protein
VELAKHVAGQPLSAAEHRQRRDAARARWALTGAGLATGAAAGAFIGTVRAQTRVPAQTRAALDAASARIETGRARLEANIIAAIRARQRAHPIPPAAPAASIPPVPGAPPVAPTPVRPPVLVIGNVQNRRIYDYQIAELGRLMRRARFKANATTEIPRLQAEINTLTRLRGRPPGIVGRSATVRQATRRVLGQLEDRLRVLDAQGVAMRRAGATQAQIIEHARLRQEAAAAYDAALNPNRVRAAVVEQWRGGETQKARADRIGGQRAQLNALRDHLLTQLTRRTAHLDVTARNHVIRAMRGRVLRASGRGALIGGAIGLTAVGMAMLVRHIAGATSRKKIAKMAKAAPDSPEGQIGRGLAETFRQWIDRLLGNNDLPMNLGDGFALAMAPGITEAFAAGAQNPPIDPASDPRAHVDVDFDSINPSVRLHMASYALDRIVQMTIAQREAIRDAIMKQSVLQGINPNEVARTIKEAIGLTSYQTTVVDSFRLGLRQLDPRVLERKLRDRRYDRTLSNAIATNTLLTDDQINAMVDAYHRRFVALRARTIARTEALRATSFGGLARAQQVLDENPDLEVTKQWLATDDERTRDTHVDLNGREVEGMETEFVTTKGNRIRWPLDVNAAADEVINCRCTLRWRFHPKRSQLMAVAA